MKNDDNASVMIIKIIIIALILLGIMAVSVIGANTIVKSIKIILSNNYEMNVLSSKTKVHEILADNNIEIKDNEIVQPDINASISDNNTIHIYKQEELSKIAETDEVLDYKTIMNNYGDIKEKIEIIEEVIPFETITKDISNEEGIAQESVVQNGKNGLEKVTYKVKYKNDVEIDRERISSEVIEEPVDKIVEVRKRTITSRSSALSRGKVSYNNGKWSYSGADLDLICAVVAQECGSSYEGALAVITCACNRAENSRWSSKGSDPLSQLKAKGQFCYSIDRNWRNKLNGRYSSVVKEAVEDALNGKRNHEYLSFNSASSGRRGTNIGGNVYYNHK